MEAFNIIGIDPGNNLGVSCFTINESYEILNIDTRLIKLSNNIEEYEHNVDRLQFLSTYIEYLYSFYKPSVVSLESAFMNTKFATAIIQLTQYVTIIEQTLNKLDPFVKIYKYPPKYIKRIVATGDANKNDMLSAVSEINEIVKLLNIEKLSEHEIDATAIAYVLLNDIRKYPVLLYTI